MTTMPSLAPQHIHSTAVLRRQYQQFRFHPHAVAKNHCKQQQLQQQSDFQNVCYICNNTEPSICICASHMKSSNHKFLLILFLCTAALLLAGSGLPTVTAGTNPRVPFQPARTEPGECHSIDVRNDCESFEQLHNCTVIRGFLLIVFVPPNFYKTHPCNYTKYTFPLLREITDFLIFHDVRGLKNTRNLFPNLAVIRGRRLFMDYALGITAMPDLESLEFSSLIAIQRGQIYINKNPKLCNIDKVDFDRITLSVGQNHIYYMAPDDCPIKTVCHNCVNDHCWSNDVCQHFENDNLIDFQKGIQHCHSECLGGCYNSSSDGCYTCKNREDHGNCVKECPPDKYLMEIYQTCHTADECSNLFNMTVKDNKCLIECPEDYVFDINGRDIIGCIPCDFPMRDDIYVITSLGDAYRLRGCKSLNASLVITIRNTVNEDDLANSLSNLREIHGFVKIVGSDGLTSLKFLKNLQKIADYPDRLENEVYGLVIYDNENLKDLWQPETNLEVVHGSMYVQMNKKLCNRKLREFARKIIHDVLYDALQINDQEVLCDPAKLTLDIEILSHRSAKFSWPKEQTSNEVEIMYRPIPMNEDYVEHSELDTHVCKRIEWTRILAFPKELESNKIHYSYTAKGLKPRTRYACLVKSFGLEDIHDTRSDLKYIITKVDLPAPPTINIIRKTDVSLTIQLGNSEDDAITHYIVSVFDHPENVSWLDKRDFCVQPSYMFHGKKMTSNADAEDEDVCCERMEEEADDRRFVHNMRKLFECNLDHPENCVPDTSLTDEPPGTVVPLKAMLRMNLDTGNTTIIHKLERYRLYTLQVQSCNDAGCGAYAFTSTRTNFSIGADRLELLTGCRVDRLNEFHVFFPEPQRPNGAITSYVVHFRLNEPHRESLRSHVECVSRAQHQLNNYHLIAQLDAPFNEVAVRVYSLSGDFFTPWTPLTICPFKSAIVQSNAPKEKLKGHLGTVIAVCIVFGACTFLAWACIRWSWWRWHIIELFLRKLSRIFTRQPRRRNEADEALVEFHNVPEEERLENAE